MRRSFPITIPMEEVGAALAHLDSEAQGRFFYTFCKELLSACGTEYKSEMQLLHAVEMLPSKHRELLGCLGPERKSDVES